MFQYADYLRGKNGVVVEVTKCNDGFVVRIKGKMGWSEVLVLKGARGQKWAHSGTLKIFKTYDLALKAGVVRVDELIYKLNNGDSKGSKRDNNE